MREYLGNLSCYFEIKNKKQIKFTLTSKVLNVINLLNAE